MKRKWHKMFGLIKKIFIKILTSPVHGSNHTKCISLSKQKCMTQPTLINLHPNEYRQEFHYYPFVVKLDRCVGSCNTLTNKVCVPNKTGDLNRNFFNMITRIYESKTLTKHMSCKWKYKFDGRKCNLDKNGGITINFNVSIKNIIYVKKIMFGILLHVILKMENSKY